MSYGEALSRLITGFVNFTGDSLIDLLVILDGLLGYVCVPLVYSKNYKHNVVANQVAAYYDNREHYTH